MKVFMSWSGATSKAVAELLAVWAKCVVQQTEPWISTTGIDRGAMWNSAINEQLNATSVGIVCLTHENKNKPWILFESGALAKGLMNTRVCTFLIDLQAQDLEPPLSQFNHTSPDRAGLLALAGTLNSNIASPLPANILEKTFDAHWDWFDKTFNKILADRGPIAPPEPRSPDSILNELLENSRSISARLRAVENRAFSSVKAGDRLLDLADLPKWTNQTKNTKIMRSSLDFGFKTALEMLQEGAEPHAVKNALIQRGFEPDFIEKIMQLVDEKVQSDLSDQLDEALAKIRQQKSEGPA